MRLSNTELIGLNGDGVENRGNEPLARISPTPSRQLNADLELRHGNRRNRDIVIVVDHIGQGITPALGVDSCPREAPATRPPRHHQADWREAPP